MPEIMSTRERHQLLFTTSLPGPPSKPCSSLRKITNLRKTTCQTSAKLKTTSWVDSVTAHAANACTSEHKRMRSAVVQNYRSFTGQPKEHAAPSAKLKATSWVDSVAAHAAMLAQVSTRERAHNYKTFTTQFERHVAPSAKLKTTSWGRFRHCSCGQCLQK